MFIQRLFLVMTLFLSVSGMFWDWNPNHHPYIGGGYCSAKAGTEANLIQRLAEPVGPRMFFAGEATCTPGATAHAALDSGERAARMVSEVLRSESGQVGKLRCIQ